MYQRKEAEKSIHEVHTKCMLSAGEVSYLCHMERRMLRIVGEPDTLSRWMEGLFPPAQVGFTRAQYGVGALPDGRTVFPYTDRAGRVIDGKVMAYGTDGHRVKDDNRLSDLQTYRLSDISIDCQTSDSQTADKSIDWQTADSQTSDNTPASEPFPKHSSASLQSVSLKSKKDSLKVCQSRNVSWLHALDRLERPLPLPLFGEDLLGTLPFAPICLVESEKTALIMANFYGQLDRQLWIACGGLKHLHLDSMQPLIDMGRTVWLWPDKDGVDEWQKLADKLGSDRVNIYTKFFDTCWLPEDGDKADAADITIRMMRKPETIEDSHTETTESTEHVTVAGIECEPVEWNTDEPFLDPLEQIDPRVREWREILRRRYNFNKSKKQ